MGERAVRCTRIYMSIQKATVDSCTPELSVLVRVEIIELSDGGQSSGPWQMAASSLHQGLTFPMLGLPPRDRGVFFFGE